MKKESTFDKAFPYRKNTVPKSYRIDKEAYAFLKKINMEYNATVSDIVNACIDELVTTKKRFSRQEYDRISSMHSFFIDKDNLKGLEQLKRHTGIPIWRLVNIAIRNVMQWEE